MLRILATAAVLALSVTAAQAEDAEIVSQTVHYGDLNLGNSQDAKILSERLQAAAKTVCVSTGTPAGDMHSCMDFAIAQAISTIEARVGERLRLQLASNKE